MKNNDVIYVQEKSVNISEFLLTRALELCKEPIISIFMSNIIDGK